MLEPDHDSIYGSAHGTINIHWYHGDTEYLCIEVGDDEYNALWDVDGLGSCIGSENCKVPDPAFNKLITEKLHLMYGTV